MKIKNSLLIFCSIFLFSSCYEFLHMDAITGSTLIWESGSNNYFNQEESTILDGTKYIYIDGEVEKEIRLKLTRMPFRSITVIEARNSGSTFNGTIVEKGDYSKVVPTKENPVQVAANGAPSIKLDNIDFYGTFRYDGYALCDILSAIKIDKVSKEDFWPPVDLYVEVSNEAGDMAVFSWGELFYSANMYSIIIAKRATRVFTGKTGEIWALPSQMQLVVESDKFGERNIPNPTRITIKSLKGNYIVNRDSTVFIGQPDKVDISVTHQKRGETEHLASITSPSEELASRTCHSLYYGHGMGFKGEKTFTGQLLFEVLAPYFSSTDAKSLREGIISVAAIDGYRASFSLSEIINRNDYREVLLMHNSESGEEAGRSTFSIYAGCDNFADRSIKGLTEVRLILPD